MLQPTSPIGSGAPSHTATRAPPPHSGRTSARAPARALGGARPRPDDGSNSSNSDVIDASFLAVAMVAAVPVAMVAAGAVAIVPVPEHERAMLLLLLHAV